MPEVLKAFRNLQEVVFKDGALDRKTKELIAVVVASMMRCEHCTESHINKSRELGATKEEIAEALSVARVIDGGTQVNLTKLFQRYL